MGLLGALADPSPWVLAGWLALAALALACFAGVIALRLLRRGRARHWIGPSTAAVALMPAVAGTGIACLQFREAMAGLVLAAPASSSGSGGVAALAAGSAESLVPLLAGLGCTALLAFLGLACVAV